MVSRLFTLFVGASAFSCALSLFAITADAQVWLACFQDLRLNVRACTCCNNGANSEHDAYCFVSDFEPSTSMPPWFEFFSFDNNLQACLDYCYFASDGYYCNNCASYSPSACFLAEADQPGVRGRKRVVAAGGPQDGASTRLLGDARKGFGDPPDVTLRKNAWACVSENADPSSCMGQFSEPLVHAVVQARDNASYSVRSACNSPPYGVCSSYNTGSGTCCITAVGQCSNHGAIQQLTQSCGPKQASSCSGDILSPGFESCNNWFTDPSPTDDDQP